MPLRVSALKPSNTSTITVYVDQYDKINFSGRVYIEALNSTFVFCGVCSLLKQLDSIYNCLNFPLATHPIRSFSGVKVKGGKWDSSKYIKKIKDREESGGTYQMEQKEIKLEAAGKGTFIIRVLYRQNATWQGNIQWIEGKKSQNFRSELELIKLIDDAITSEGEAEDMAKWE